MAISKVGVVGCGLMGGGIAQTCAQSGHEVVVSEVNQQLLDKGLSRIYGAWDMVNFLLIPYLIAAIRMLENGQASRDDIDNAMKLGCGYPMGPFTLLDYVGLDTALWAAEAIYEEYKDPLYAPPPLLRRMVQSGMYGKKSGKGFCDYH
jgi:3-hydroxyacyl-CoA dehydrogenase